MRLIVILGTAFGLTVTALPGAPPPTAATQEPGGTLVVTNKGANTASLIDLARGEVVATVPVGNGPHEVAVSGDGRWAVATNYGTQTPNNSLTVIDVARGQVISTIDLGRYSRPHGAFFLPGDSLLSVTSESTASVVLVDVLGGAISGAVPTGQQGSHMVTRMAADGRAYTSNIGSGTITAMNLLTREMIRIIEVAPQVEAIQLAPGGEEVWVGSNALGTVSVVVAADGHIRGTLTGFSFPYRIAFTRDARSALIPDLNRHEVRIFDTATLAETGRISIPGGGPEGIVVVSDRFAYLSLSREDAVAVIDLETQRITRRLPTGSGPDGIGYSPLLVEARP